MLTMVSFAVTRRAYSRIIPSFCRRYEAETGVRVRFRQSYGGSGAQARAVIDGMPADVAALALPLDVIKMAQAGIVGADWRRRLPRDSTVSESVACLVTRRGNPLGIRGWDDLVRPDVSVIMANPRTAGVARWTFFALWGHRLDEGEEAARDYLRGVLRRVAVQPRDAREASDVFYKQRKGDVLLTYENEARFTNAVGDPEDALPYLSPNNNVLIRCPLALLDRNLDAQPPEARKAAQAFATSLFELDAQKEFVRCGFRSALPEAEAVADDAPPAVKGLWDVEERLGKWETLQKIFFDDGGVYATLQNELAEERAAARKKGQR